MPTKFVTAEEFRFLLVQGTEVAPLDVRDEGAFSLDHILQARCLPVAHIEIAALDLVPRLTTPIVLIDEDSRDGGPASRARDRLRQLGYRNISILRGGQDAWKTEGHAVFSGVHVPSKAFGEHVEHAHALPNISADQLANLQSRDGDVVVLDVRPFAEYDRFHIPGAINVPGVELIHRIADVAPDPTTSVVVNCAGRTRSIIGAQSLLNAGLPNPVMALTNGTMGWHLAGHTLEKGAGTVAAAPSSAAVEKSLGYADTIRKRFSVKPINPDQLAEWQRDESRSIYIFDVRSHEEYVASHVAGARHVPGGQLIQETDRYVGTLNSRIVLVDDTGARATMAASWLMQMGWSDVAVLTNHQLIPIERGPFVPTIAEPNGATGASVSVDALYRELEASDDLVVIDVGSSLKYRNGHIPGAWWAKRLDLVSAKDRIPVKDRVVLTCGDGRLARIVSADLVSLLPDCSVQFLQGGNEAWCEAGHPLETGFDRGLSETNDVWYKPYDHKDGVESRMQQYLSWEVDLLDRARRDGTLKFPEIEGANVSSSAASDQRLRAVRSAQKRILGRNLMAHEKSLTELDKRRTEAAAMGGPDKLAKRKKRGVLNAWERLQHLVDKDSFIETGLLGGSSISKKDEVQTPRDGKLVGFAKIEDRDVAVCVNDFTVKGASTSATNSKKIGHIRRTATEKGIPFVHIGESTGARLPDAMGSRGMGNLLGNDPTQFRRTRESPWAAAALDTSFGSSAWLCCCSDFAVMRKGSIMSVSSPRLVSMAIGESVDPEELGGWRIHADHTGLIDSFVDTDEEAMAEIRRFLGYMPSHNMEAPPVYATGDADAQDQTGILDILPEKRTQVYDMRKIVQLIVDKDSVFELKPRFGKPAITALARLNGKSIGLMANNPIVGGGALSAEACRKLIDFQVLCDSFNIPIVRLMDTPGFVVGTDAERKGAPGWIMNFMNSTCLVTVPSITVIVRKAYGRAYVAMGGGRHNDELIAWPTAEVSFMDPVFATTIVHGLAPGDDGFENALAHIQKDIEIWDMAKIYSAQNIIKPQETRDYLIRMFEIYQSRKSGCIGQHLMQNWPTSF